MDKYIFLSSEGYTYQPGSSNPEPDIDNMQVIGFGQGNTARIALVDMLEKNGYLAETGFDEVIALKLVDDTRNILSIKDSLTRGR